MKDSYNPEGEANALDAQSISMFNRAFQKMNSKYLKDENKDYLSLLDGNFVIQKNPEYNFQAEKLEDYEEAVKLLLEVLERNNSHLLSCELLGISYFRLKDYVSAKTYFSMLVNTAPKYAKGWFDLANSEAKLRNSEEAIKHYTKAIEADPNFVMAYVSRGGIKRNLKQPESALEDFNKALELDPKNVIALNNRGIVFGRRGELRMALKDFTSAIEADPNYTESYYNRAVAWTKMGKAEKAQEDLEVAWNRQFKFP